MRTGIFGGTFDPVHIGHIKMAEYAKEEFGLEEVVFVPNSNPPHKKDKLIEDYSHRFNMLKLALGDDERFSISDYEAKDGWDTSAGDFCPSPGCRTWDKTAGDFCPSTTDHGRSVQSGTTSRSERHK